ncbi:hypothetical protein DFQ27_009417 [Actinomortierella ambigua]|uniref:BTB domain-containing protein n=1 Tax=Actinomortierella ambigua TaxID=1343610 RepID=A0A9P6PN30_9FUNG|nr:hypothetical protein DFQ27_009417 [Actinomortierella ambigua]
MSFFARLSENLRELSLSSENADATFLVGPGEAVRYAHSLILNARSTFFNRLLTPTPKESKARLIRLPSIDPEIFDLVIDYIYAGQCTFTTETLPKLAAAAHELELHELKTGCEEYACKNLTDENASTMLSTADENAMLLLRASSLDYICRHARAVLSSEAILTLDQDLFTEVVASDKLAIDELEVWRAVVRWALAQCHLNFHYPGILRFPDFPGRLAVVPVYEEYDKIVSPPPPTGASLGKEDSLIYMSVADHTSLCNSVAPMLSYIRFPLISVDNFCRLIEGTGLLPCEASLKIYRHHAISSDITGCRLPLPYRATPPTAAVDKTTGSVTTGKNIFFWGPKAHSAPEATKSEPEAAKSEREAAKSKPDAIKSEGIVPWWAHQERTKSTVVGSSTCLQHPCRS